MALTRISTLNLFAPLAPPWLLTSLDQNSAFETSAFNDASLGWSNGPLVDSGSANNYNVTCSYGSPSSYNPGMQIAFIPGNTNTGSSTMTVAVLGALVIQTPAGNPLLGGEIVQNRACLLMVNASSTAFLIVGPCPAIANFGSVAVNQTLECAGCTSVFAYAAFTASGKVITFNHLAAGVPVTVGFLNSSGGSASFAIGANNPAGTSYTGVTTVPGGGIGAGVNILTGAGSFTLGNNQYRMFSGQSLGLTLFLT